MVPVSLSVKHQRGETRGKMKAWAEKTSGAELDRDRQRNYTVPTGQEVCEYKQEKNCAMLLPTHATIWYGYDEGKTVTMANKPRLLRF